MTAPNASPPKQRFSRARLVAIVLCAIMAWGGLQSVTTAAPKPNIFYKMVFLKDMYDQISKDEHAALASFRQGKLIDTRTQVERLLAKDNDSIVGHFLLAYILRHAEGELIRALRHLRRARKLYKVLIGRIPSMSHHVMMVELFSSLRQLGREKECLALIERHDKLYSNIKLEDVRPWVLMKMRRFKEARAMATRYLKEKRFISSSLNAMCAISFEQNDRKASLDYCLKAYRENLKKKSTTNRSVSLYNLSESYLSLFDLNQAEKFALDATKHFHRYLPSTPWEFLVGLYLDLGRYNDAWNALQRSRDWYMRQAPQLSESVYASNQMTQSVFFLTMGKPDVSLKILERIRDRPDRRGHMSADTRQFVVGARLLRRKARLLQAEKLREIAATKGVGARLGAWFEGLWLRLLAWRDGAQARRALADSAFLARSVSPYRSGSFSMPNSAVPYWMVGDIIPLVGPAVIRDALELVWAEEGKTTPRLRPFLLAIEAEAVFRQGDDTKAGQLITLALQQLPPRLAPLRHRLLTIEGEIARRNGKYVAMQQAFARVLRKNGAPFRFLRIPLPVAQIKTSGHGTYKVSEMLLRSPRFTMHYKGFQVRLQAIPPAIKASLADSSGTVLHQFHLAPKPKEAREDFLRRFAIGFQNGLFSPHFRLSRKQIFSLDDSLLRTSSSTLKLPDDTKPETRDKPPERRKRRKRRKSRR